MTKSEKRGKEHTQKAEGFTGKKADIRNVEPIFSRPKKKPGLKQGPKTRTHKGNHTNRAPTGKKLESRECSSSEEKKEET